MLQCSVRPSSADRPKPQSAEYRHHSRPPAAAPASSARMLPRPAQDRVHRQGRPLQSMVHSDGSISAKQSGSLMSTVQEVHDAYGTSRVNKLTVPQLQIFLKSMEDDGKGKRDALLERAKVLLKDLLDSQQ